MQRQDRVKFKPVNITVLFGFVILLVLQILVVNGVFSGEKTEVVIESGKVNNVGGDMAGAAVPDSSTTTTTVPTEPEKPVIIPMLVNKENVMSADFVPVNIVEIGKSVKGTPTIKLNATVLEAYKVMYADIKEADVTVPSIISGYRSYAKQKQLYDKKVAQYGPGQKVTAAPGTSEHQYSACIDISTDGTCQNNFGELDIGKWIAQNSYKYGFVVRYPVDKKELTGINFEPWHIRYVGVEHATYMYEHSLCLEEYVVYLRETYPDAVDEQSPDDFPAPRWAGDLGE